mmetsp:Transcript_16311/g.38333  ORF Transcript_16311/g.38333 Transcript_16311/m.38333 type:complete len:219 (-) Transcript_16311:1065-1721(-)
MAVDRCAVRDHVVHEVAHSLGCNVAHPQSVLVACCAADTHRPTRGVIRPGRRRGGLSVHCLWTRLCKVEGAHGGLEQLSFHHAELGGRELGQRAVELHAGAAHAHAPTELLLPADDHCVPVLRLTGAGENGGGVGGAAHCAPVQGVRGATAAADRRVAAREDDAFNLGAEAQDAEVRPPAECRGVHVMAVPHPVKPVKLQLKLAVQQAAVLLPRFQLH